MSLAYKLQHAVTGDIISKVVIFKDELPAMHTPLKSAVPLKDNS